MLNITPIPAFKDNYIWAIHLPDSDKVIIVDPGDPAVVENYLAEQQSGLAAILITHHHEDHINGIESLAKQHQISVYGPGNSDIPGITRPVSDNNLIKVGGLSIRVMATPGHTLDHLIYLLLDEQPQLFTGDLLFSAGCGRLFEGSAEQMFDSLQRLKTLPDNTLIYPAHEYTQGNLTFACVVEPENNDLHLYQEKCHKLRLENQPTLPTSLITEMKINPFLRTNKKPVIEAVSGLEQSNFNDEAALFAGLREWKDAF